MARRDLWWSLCGLILWTLGNRARADGGRGGGTCRTDFRYRSAVMFARVLALCLLGGCTTTPTQPSAVWVEIANLTDLDDAYLLTGPSPESFERLNQTLELYHECLRGATGGVDLTVAVRQCVYESTVVVGMIVYPEDAGQRIRGVIARQLSDLEIKKTEDGP